MAASASPDGSDDFVVLDGPNVRELPFREKNSINTQPRQRADSYSSNDDIEHVDGPGSVKSIDTPSETPSTLADNAGDFSTTPPAASLYPIPTPWATNQAEQPHDHTSPSRSPSIHLTAQASPTLCYNHVTIDQQIMDLLIESALTAHIEREHGHGSVRDMELRWQMMTRFRSLPADHNLVQQSLIQAQGDRILFPGQKRNATEVESIYRNFFTNVERMALNFFVECHIRQFETACFYYGAFMPCGRDALNRAMRQPGADKGKALALEIQTTVLTRLDGDRAFTEPFDDLRRSTRSFLTKPIHQFARPSSVANTKFVGRDSMANKEQKKNSELTSHTRAMTIRRIFHATLSNLPNTVYSNDHPINRVLITGVKREPPVDDNALTNNNPAPPTKKLALALSANASETVQWSKIASLDLAESVLPWPIVGPHFNTSTAMALRSMSSRMEAFWERNKRLQSQAPDEQKDSGSYLTTPFCVQQKFGEMQNKIMKKANLIHRGSASSDSKALPHPRQVQYPPELDPAFQPAGYLAMQFWFIKIHNWEEPLTEYEKMWIREYALVNAQRCDSDEKQKLVEKRILDMDLYRHVRRHKLDSLDYYFRMEALLQLRSMQFMTRSDAQDTVNTTSDALQVSDVSSTPAQTQVKPACGYQRYLAQRAQLSSQKEDQSTVPPRNLLVPALRQIDSNLRKDVVQDYHDALAATHGGIQIKTSVRRREKPEGTVPATMSSVRSRVSTALASLDTAVETGHVENMAITDASDGRGCTYKTENPKWPATLQDTLSDLDCDAERHKSAGLVARPSKAAHTREATWRDDLEEHFSAQSRVALSGFEGPTREYRQNTLLAQSTNLPTSLDTTAAVDAGDFGRHTRNPGTVGSKPTYQFAPAARTRERSKTFAQWRDELKLLEDHREYQRKFKEWDSLTLQGNPSDTTLVPDQEMTLQILDENVVNGREAATPNLPVELSPRADEQDRSMKMVVSTETMEISPSSGFTPEEVAQLILLEAQSRKRYELAMQESFDDKTPLGADDKKLSLPSHNTARPQENHAQLTATKESTPQKSMHSGQAMLLSANETSLGSSSTHKESVILENPDRSSIIACQAKLAILAEESKQSHTLWCRPRTELDDQSGVTTVELKQKSSEPVKTRDEHPLLQYEAQLKLLEQQSKKRYESCRKQENLCVSKATMPEESCKDAEPSHGTVTASVHTMVKRDGVLWIAFDYVRDGVKMEYCIRADVDSVDITSILPMMKVQTCLNPSRTVIAGQQEFEDRALTASVQKQLEENRIGWALAHLNPCLRSSPRNDLLRTAVHCYIQTKTSDETVKTQANDTGPGGGDAASAQSAIPSNDPFVIQHGDEIMADAEGLSSSSESSDEEAEDECEDENGMKEQKHEYDMSRPPFFPKPFEAEGRRHITFDHCRQVAFAADFYSIRADIELVSIKDVRRQLTVDHCVCPGGPIVRGARPWHTEECDISLALHELNPMLRGEQNKKLLSSAVGNFFVVRDAIGWHQAETHSASVMSHVVSATNVDEGFVDFTFEGMRRSQCVYCNVILEDRRYDDVKIVHLRGCQGFARRQQSPWR